MPSFQAQNYRALWCRKFTWHGSKLTVSASLMACPDSVSCESWFSDLPLTKYKCSIFEMEAVLTWQTFCCFLVFKTCFTDAFADGTGFPHPPLITSSHWDSGLLGSDSSSEYMILNSHHIHGRPIKSVPCSPRTVGILVKGSDFLQQLLICGFLLHQS